MADAKSTDPKRPDAKSGPVKPPVLDLQARSSDAKPEPDAAKPAAAPQPASKPTTAAKAPEAAGNGFAIGSAIAGGVLGLGLAYGLAWFGYWPGPKAPVVQADPRLGQFGGAITELQTVTATTQSELAALTGRVTGLQQAGGAPAAPPPNLGAVEADIAALAARIDGLSAARGDSVALTEVEALRTQLAGLGSRLDELGARVGTTEAGMRTLQTSVDETSAAVARQPADVGAVLQLPLVLSGFEAAFATGRPYEAELAALRAAMPGVAVPTAIANGATTGLARPDMIAAQFAAVLPAILAGRPANPDAGWQDGALDWLRSAIALRPTGELAGDAPEAVVSRLEAAIARRDYAAAQALMASLPAPMQAAAGEVPALLAAQAEAAHFLDTLRARALNGVESAT